MSVLEITDMIDTLLYLMHEQHAFSAISNEEIKRIYSLKTSSLTKSAIASESCIKIPSWWTYIVSAAPISSGLSVPNL